MAKLLQYARSLQQTNNKQYTMNNNVCDNATNSPDTTITTRRGETKKLIEEIQDKGNDPSDIYTEILQQSHTIYERLKVYMYL